MIADISRLIFGMLIVLFHKPISEWILARERELIMWFGHHGLHMPEMPSTDFAHNLYFCIGIFVAFFSMARIWSALLIH